ncbi:muscular LMNA-interacting protein-like isoform X1 [Cetorhinus maximus]
MKSAVHVNETAKPLAFTFVPTVRRLPVHIQVIDTTRSSPQPGKQQKPEANSSIMNEPLHITEEMPATDVRMADTIGGGTPRRHMEIGQSWLNKEREYVPAEEAAPLQGIFKAELVFLADSYGSDSDCLSRGTEAEVNLSAKTLPLLSLSPNTFADDKSSSIRAKEVVGESKAPLLQDAEQKVDEALQEPFFQSSTSRTPDNLTIQPLTSTIGNGDSIPADLRHVCTSSLFNKSSLCFPAKTNSEKKSSSLPRSTFLTSSETSFLSSSSLPSALNSKSLSLSNSPLKKSKTASPSYPPPPLHFLSCSDLQSSPAWSSSSSPSSRSTTCSSTRVQSSLHSSNQNIRSPTSQRISCYSPRILNDSSLTSTHTNAAKSAVVSSPPTQLSLLTSILRSGKRPLVSSKSSDQSKLVSSATSLSTICSQSPSKSPSPTTPQASSSCQKARTLSPTPGKSLLDSSRTPEDVSSVSSRSINSPLSPEPGKHSLHSSLTSLSQRHGNVSTETAQAPSGLSPIKQNIDHSNPGNSTAALTSLCHGSKPLILPHCPSPRHGQLSPGTGQFTSHRFSPISSFSPTQKLASPLSDPILDNLPSERANKISPTPHYSNLNYSPVKLGSLSLTPTSPPLSHSARHYSISPLSEQSLPSSTTSISSSPTPVNSSPQSGSITPTPLNISSLFSSLRSGSVSPTQNQTTPHSSSLRPSSRSPTPTYSSSLRPPTPGRLPVHLSPFPRPNASVSTPAHSAAHFSNPRLDITSPGPVQSPSLPSHFSRPGTQSPSQPLSCSTENEAKKPEQKYKIKSSYKAFAAIPTNTLLLEQKAIDEAISDSEESAAANTSEKTHSQFLFESESLRQQSEELYATIEQLLEDPLPTCCSSSAPKSLQKPQDSKAHKHVSPTPKSAGRETKYANLHLSVPESTENRPTRPGVIRPVANVQKTPATPKMEESGLNPFRQCLEETSDTEIKEPRHSIMTIHENEALAINELTHVTTKLNRDQHQSQGRRRESERSLLPNTDSNQEVLMILEEELEQAVKT